MVEYAIAFALRRASKVVRGFEQGLTETEGYALPPPPPCVGQARLTETERYAVADHIVCQLTERGDLLKRKRPLFALKARPSGTPSPDTPAARLEEPKLRQQTA